MTKIKLRIHIVDTIIKNLKKHNLVGETQNVTVIYNAESQDVLYTVAETAKLLKTGVNNVYELIRAGLLPALKLGNMKIRKVTLEEFLAKYEGYDLTDLSNNNPLKDDE